MSIEDQIHAIEMIINSGYIHELWPSLEAAIATLRELAACQRENERLRAEVEQWKAGKFEAEDAHSETLTDRDQLRAECARLKERCLKWEADWRSVRELLNTEQAAHAETRENLGKQGEQLLAAVKLSHELAGRVTELENAISYCGCNCHAADRKETSGIPEQQTEPDL